MTYAISCDCGQSLQVTALQAGTTVACPCGQTIDVPTMSTLRRQAGETAIPQNVVEKIQGMVSREELPSNKTCPVTGLPADTKVYLHAECERTYTKHSGPTGGADRYFIALILLGWFWAAIYLVGRYIFGRKSSVEEFGRDVGVTFPLLIAATAQEQFMGTRNQKKLKQWMQSTPIYAELLEEYPSASVTHSSH